MENTGSIANILTQAGLLFTWVFNQLSVVVQTIVSNPILLIGMLTMLVGLVIGVFKRLSNVS